MDDADAAEAEGPVAAEGIERGMTDKQWQMNYLWTVLLDLGLLLLLPVVLFFGIFNLALAENQGHVRQAAEGSIVLVWGLIGIFILAVVLSIVSLVRHRRAVYIPILGGIAMIVVCQVAIGIGGFRPQ